MQICFVDWSLLPRLTMYNIYWHQRRPETLFIYWDSVASINVNIKNNVTINDKYETTRATIQVSKTYTRLSPEIYNIYNVNYENQWNQIQTQNTIESWRRKIINGKINRKNIKIPLKAFHAQIFSHISKTFSWL